MDPQQIPPPLQTHENGNCNGNGMINNGGIGGNENHNLGIDGVLYVKVMTDEQLEILRTQIAVYATICEQLVEMHKAVTAQQDLAGFFFLSPLFILLYSWVFIILFCLFTSFIELGFF